MNRTHIGNPLVEQASSGDREALVSLLLDHSHALKTHIGHEFPAALRGRVAVEDLLQETFVQAFCLIERFEPRSDGSFLSWLKALADNQMRETVRAIDRQKRGRGFRQVADPVRNSSGRLVELIERLSDRGKTPSSLAAIREAELAIHVGMAALPDEQREAVRLRYVEGKSIREAAEDMGRTPGAIRGLVYRAKETLREMLGKSSRWFAKK